mmetsp:Transcript_17997/g.30263  ORF Transcript_17997/g.30263 Transcript_17997/m.30263 type:complete len:256 (+) Transcript_17997:130-897(+)
MFARPKKKGKKKSNGLAILAKYVNPSSSSNKIASLGEEEDKLPISSPTSINANSISTMTTSETVASTLSLASQLTGDKNSYTFSRNDNNVYYNKGSGMKGYRVLSYKKSKKNGGQRIVFDILDGKPYHCGVGLQRRITSDALVFETKEQALSERFPSNQFAGTKSGNGRLPRMLVAFDMWGHCRQRHGGVASKVCEYARFLQVVEYLDPPHPLVTRLVKRNVQPYNFPGPDTKHKPNRERVELEVKRYRMFNPKK